MSPGSSGLDSAVADECASKEDVLKSMGKFSFRLAMDGLEYFLDCCASVIPTHLRLELGGLA